MLKKICMVSCLALSVTLVSGCHTHMSKKTAGTVAGAAIGGTIGGVASAGNPYAIVGGAAAGGYVGRQLAR